MSNLESKYWTAFYTRPRNEKKVAERLSERGYIVYCPTRIVIKQWSDRKRKVKEPLFTSYIFAMVDELERQEILRDQGIVSSVFWLKKPVIIRDVEIEAIRGFLEDYPLAIAENLNQGDRILVESGPLSGQKGIIKKISGNKAHLTITSLRLVVKAQIGIVSLKKIADTSPYN